MADNEKEDKKEAAEPKRGVGTAAREAIAAGMDNEEALAAVQKEFPDAKTSIASINWYRNKMRADDKSIKTSRELKKEKAAKDTKDDGKGDEAGGTDSTEEDPLG